MELMKAHNENDHLASKFSTNLQQTLDLTLENNRILDAQGKSLDAVDQKNKAIDDQVGSADRTLK